MTCIALTPEKEEPTPVLGHTRFHTVKTSWKGESVPANKWDVCIRVVVSAVIVLCRLNVISFLPGRKTIP